MRVNRRRAFVGVVLASLRSLFATASLVSAANVQTPPAGPPYGGSVGGGFSGGGGGGRRSGRRVLAGRGRTTR